MGDAGQTGQDLLALFSERDIELLREDLDTVGTSGWLAWCDESMVEIQGFLRASERQREQKKWGPDARRRRLGLAAYRLACLAIELGPLREDSGYGPARERLAFAGGLAWRVWQSPVLAWPFWNSPPQGWVSEWN